MTRNGLGFLNIQRKHIKVSLFRYLILDHVRNFRSQVITIDRKKIDKIEKPVIEAKPQSQYEDSDDGFGKFKNSIKSIRTLLFNFKFQPFSWRNSKFRDGHK